MNHDMRFFNNENVFQAASANGRAFLSDLNVLIIQKNKSKHLSFQELYDTPPW